MRVWWAVFLLSPACLLAALPKGFESPDADLVEDLDWVMSADGMARQMAYHLADEDNPIVFVYSQNPIHTVTPSKNRAAAMFNPSKNIVLLDGQFRLIKDDHIRRLLLWRTWRHELWHVFNHQIRVDGFLSAEERVGDVMLDESLRQEWAQGLGCQEQLWELRENQTLRDIHYDACQEATDLKLTQADVDFSQRQILKIEEEVGPYLQEPSVLRELEYEHPRKAARIYYLLGLRFMANGENSTREFARAVSLYR